VVQKLVKFVVKANRQGQYYLPKLIRQELGEELGVICNTKAAVIFNSKTSLESVLRSIAVLTNDLNNRLEIQKEEKSDGVQKC
jgi:bifunctional DNA-binding transcriptional regulator/antitoxin component of YhaV-PrlF toxin-antitoxin module